MGTDYLVPMEKMSVIAERKLEEMAAGAKPGPASENASEMDQSFKTALMEETKIKEAVNVSLGDKAGASQVAQEKPVAAATSMENIKHSTHSLNLDMQKSSLMMQSVIDMQKDPDFTLVTGDESKMVV